MICVVFCYIEWQEPPSCCPMALLALRLCRFQNVLKKNYSYDGMYSKPLDVRFWTGIIQASRHIMIMNVYDLWGKQVQKEN